MNLFQLADVTLSSGRKSIFKLECDAFTDDDVTCLAALIAKMVGPFGSVKGVPRGGLRLAAALRYHQSTTIETETHLIVDDVFTTGRSMEAARASDPAYGLYPIIGAVVFARGPCPPWIQSLFPMHPKLWDV